MEKLYYISNDYGLVEKMSQQDIRIIVDYLKIHNLHNKCVDINTIIDNLKDKLDCFCKMSNVIGCIREGINKWGYEKKWTGLDNVIFHLEENRRYEEILHRLFILEKNEDEILEYLEKNL